MVINLPRIMALVPYHKIDRETLLLSFKLNNNRSSPSVPPYSLQDLLTETFNLHYLNQSSGPRHILSVMGTRSEIVLAKFQCPGLYTSLFDVASLFLSMAHELET